MESQALHAKYACFKDSEAYPESMPACLTFEQVFSTGVPRVEKLKVVGASFATYEEPGACEAFSHQVGNVEDFLRETYGIAMMIARKSEDSNEVISILRLMSDFCATAMKTLSGLKAKYPYCGTSELYDLALDYKIACDLRHNNLLAELECANQNLPAGLFPSLK